MEWCSAWGTVVLNRTTATGDEPMSTNNPPRAKVSATMIHRMWGQRLANRGFQKSGGWDIQVAHIKSMWAKNTQNLFLETYR